MCYKIKIVSESTRALVTGKSSMHPAQVIILILYSTKTHGTHAAYYFTFRCRVGVCHVAVKVPFAVELQITSFTFKIRHNLMLVHFRAFVGVVVVVVAV